jgi:hypothetical protein
MKRRERDAVLQSLQAGLVAKQGLHLIQVGRKAEVSALLQDLDRVQDEGASFRIVVGRFGRGAANPACFDDDQICRGEDDRRLFKKYREQARLAGSCPGIGANHNDSPTSTLKMAPT